MHLSWKENYLTGTEELPPFPINMPLLSTPKNMLETPSRHLFNGRNVTQGKMWKRKKKHDKVKLSAHLFEPGEVPVEVNGSLHAPSPSLPCLCPLGFCPTLSGRLSVCVCVCTAHTLDKVRLDSCVCRLLQHVSPVMCVNVCVCVSSQLWRKAFYDLCLLSGTTPP